VKKLLIVSGCSWTDINYKSDHYPDMDCSWPKWHEILAKELDVELISLGKVGAGQEYIFTSIIDYVCNMSDEDKKRIYMIIPAWTTAARRDFQIENKWHTIRWDDRGDAYYHVRRSLRYFYQFQIFCERYNFAYKQIAMLNILNMGDAAASNQLPAHYHYGSGSINLSNLQSALSSSPLYNKINGDNFIGWPIITNLGGFCIDRKVLEFKKHKISNSDRHPNQLGQQKIAEYIHENL